MSSDESQLPPEFHSLMADCLDNRLSDEQYVRLMKLVEQNAACRECYAEQMVLHSLLILQHREPLQVITTTTPPAPPVHPAEGSPVLGFLGDCLRQGMSFLSKPSVFAVLVALGLPGLMLLLLVISLKEQAPSGPSGPVATVVRTCDSVGSLGNGYKQLSPGTRLVEGQRLTLQSGVVEIEFVDGATAILEAPTAFEARNVNGGFLQIGRLTANVPPRAQGFSIETPLAIIVDRGTDFGVSVAANGTAEAHVFKGRVEVAAKTMPENPTPLVRTLAVDQAVRIQADTDRVARIVEIPASSDEFVRTFPVTLAANPPIAPEKSPKGLIASVRRSGGVSDDRVPVGRFDGQTAPLPADGLGLRSGALFYTDRTYAVATIDRPLVGVEYVRTFNSDRYNDAGFSYEVKFTTDHKEVFLMVLVDDRIGERTGSKRAGVDSIVSRFAPPGAFANTGQKVVIGGEGSKDACFTAYGMLVPTKDAGGKPIAYALIGIPANTLSSSYYSNYVIAVMATTPGTSGP